MTTREQIITAPHLSNREVCELLFTLYEVEQIETREPARDVQPFALSEVWRARIALREELGA